MTPPQRRSCTLCPLGRNEAHAAFLETSFVSDAPVLRRTGALIVPFQSQKNPRNRPVFQATATKHPKYKKHVRAGVYSSRPTSSLPGIGKVPRTDPSGSSPASLPSFQIGCCWAVVQFEFPPSPQGQLPSDRERERVSAGPCLKRARW